MTSRPWESQREPTRAELHARKVGVEFDPITHTYTLSGERLLNTTRVLKLAGFYNFDFVDPIYRDRGKDAHEAVAFAMEGDLDRAHLAASAQVGATDLQPYVAAAERFVLENDIEILYPEAVVIHPLLKYAGKIDVFGFVRRSRVLSLIDWKLGDLIPSYGIQMESYSMAWHAMTKEVVGHRYGVKLKKDGSYICREFTDRRDAGRFQAALTVVNTRRELGLLSDAEIWPNAA